MSAPLIQLQGVTKVYGSGAAGFRALDGVDLDVERGDFVAVMGASGSGKSTTMNILGCLDVPSAGAYLFKGQRVERLTRDQRALLRRRYLGFVFQGFNLLSRTSALENVELPLLYRRDPVKERHRRALKALDEVGLGPWQKHTPAELSGGQQQRVAIARALSNNPLVILADEATGNLDSKSGQEILALFDDLNAQGRTLVFVTHDERMVERCSRIIRLKDGLVDRDEPGRKMRTKQAAAA